MDALDATSQDRPNLRAFSRIVVKVGSALIAGPDDGALRTDWLAALADDIAALRTGGAQIIVVSSGAIALGRRMLGLGGDTLALDQAQAAAAVGQTALIRAWETALARHDIVAAQLLLTLDDTQQRRRYLNGRATLGSLMGLGTVPVVNENDTIATDEIRYGDNDRLAARVALMAGADALVLLSDVDGLYSADPRKNPGARLIPDVHEITPEIERMASGAASAQSRGGMRTKLLAAKTAVQGGCAMVIAQGDVLNPLSAIAGGASATWFHATTEPAAARKQWIAAMKPMGALVIDAGAVSALRRGSSLLPAGLVRVEGTFERGDPVAIVDASGSAVGAALSGYRSEDATAIAGVRSGRIEAILGHPGRTAVAHRDDMVLWNAKAEDSGEGDSDGRD